MCSEGTKGENSLPRAPGWRNRIEPGLEGFQLLWGGRGKDRIEWFRLGRGSDTTDSRTASPETEEESPSLEESSSSFSAKRWGKVPNRSKGRSRIPFWAPGGLGKGGRMFAGWRFSEAA